MGFYSSIAKFVDMLLQHQTSFNRI